MSNFDRAVKALEEADEFHGAMVDNEAYVRALEAAGLLVPDLPDSDALTFIDGSTFRLAPPEFLETKADYTDVPEGTILTMDGLDTAWVKKFDGWVSTGVSRERTSKELGYTRRRVLRWSWGK